MRKLSIACLMAALLGSMCRPARAGENDLSGGASNTTVPPVLDIAPNPTQCMNFRSTDELLAERSKLVAQYENVLLPRPYRPSAVVFEHLENGKPWWGLQGEAFWGEGQRSIEGDSEESRFFMNPLVLVGANPYEFGIWNNERITQEDIDRPDFPYTWKISSIRMWPQAKREQVVYDVSAYNNKLEEFRSKLKDEHINPKFGLVAYNARDFGYNYVYLTSDGSTNVENLEKPRDPTEIKQFLHCGGSCGYSGGCNNMSPETKSIENIKYSALPARAVVLLWKQKPRSTSDPADFTVYIDLQ